MFVGIGFELYKEDKALKKGKSFIVYGDEGGSDGRAYGKISGAEIWGYIPTESDKYKLRYYAIPYQFISIVNREEYSE